MEIVQVKQKERNENHTFPFYLTRFYFILALVTIIIQWPQPKLELDPYISYMSHNGRGSDVGGGSNLSHEPLSGTTIVVTGATSGIGLGLTLKLFDLGANVIAIGRSPSKLQTLEKELNSRRPTNKAIMTSVVADFNNLDDIALASKLIQKKFKRIDFLINNAGIHHATIPNDAKTKQDYEATFGVNYMSHFLLTKKLLPLLQKSKRTHPRIVQVTSTYHTQVDGFDLKPEMSPADEVSTSRNHFLIPPLASVQQGSFAYANSKLAQILHARALSRILQKKQNNNNNKIQIVSVCPSWVATNIPRQTSIAYLLSLVAFDRDNYGLATIFHAMFHPDAGKNDQTDYIVSSKLVTHVYWFSDLLGDRWISNLYIRQILVDFKAYVLLMVQKFFAEISFTRSSKESYDLDLQDEFYKWTEEQIAPWA